MDVASEVVDLHEAKIGLFDNGETEYPDADEIMRKFDDCDGAVFVSPEWNGMMSHGIANLQHFLNKELAHKPVMLVGVSATRGGNYPVMQMRIMGYKNNHYVISPEALVVQGVQNMFNSHNPEPGSGDEQLQARAIYALKNLFEYAKALKQVRDSGVVNFEDFKNGV